MRYILIAGGVLVGVIVVFVLWRLASVARGATKRDRRLFARLADLIEKLDGEKPLSPEDIAEYARPPELRPVIHSMLTHHGRVDLFPREMLTLEEQARAELAYWLCHPNELGDPPDEIEVVERFEKDAGGTRRIYFALQFRKEPPHWSAESGWTLGVAGPYAPSRPPVPFTSGAFSRFHSAEKSAPAEETDWYHAATASKRSIGREAT